VKSKAKKTRSVRGNESHGHGRIGAPRSPTAAPCHIGCSARAAGARDAYLPCHTADVERLGVDLAQASTASTLVAAVMQAGSIITGS